jgi:antitoxin VapB
VRALNIRNQICVYTAPAISISVRDPKCGELARKLVSLRKTNMTETIARALREQLKRERDKRPGMERLEELADETLAMGEPGGYVMTKDEIDALWGH